MPSFFHVAAYQVPSQKQGPLAEGSPRWGRSGVAAEPPNALGRRVFGHSRRTRDSHGDSQ
jgi:hypothetical protein